MTVLIYLLIDWTNFPQLKTSLAKKTRTHLTKRNINVILPRIFLIYQYIFLVMFSVVSWFISRFIASFQLSNSDMSKIILKARGYLWMFTYSLPGKFGNGTAEVFVCSKNVSKLHIHTGRCDVYETFARTRKSYPQHNLTWSLKVLDYVPQKGKLI